jgi:hypothetical protein
VISSPSEMSDLAEYMGVVRSIELVNATTPTLEASTMRMPSNNRGSFQLGLPSRLAAAET